MTWAQYRALLITDQRIANGRAAFQQNRALFERVRDRYAVDPGVIVGIWGLESSFGTGMGDFRVVEALATLAWEGRRASFFRGELMAALHILDHGDVTPARMTGSYAGAMGQPQFMPSSYLRYAVDFEGNGRRDIWTSRPDVLGSIANYLASSGWRAGEPWGQAVTVPASFDAASAGRDNRRPVGEWLRQGVRVAGGRRWHGLTCPRRSCCRTAPAATPSWSTPISARSAATTRPTTTRWRSACWAIRSQRDRLDGTAFRSAVPLAMTAALLLASCQHAPPANPHYVLGAPYQAGGAWYYPRESYERSETGIATVYPSGHADLTADGEVFDQTALAAAHQTLQLPAIARLTNLENGRQVVVRINDRGPATPHRLHRGHQAHGDAAWLSRRRWCSGAAAGVAGGEPGSGRSCAGCAETRYRDGAGRRRAAERPAAARERRVGAGGADAWSDAVAGDNRCRGEPPAAGDGDPGAA